MTEPKLNASPEPKLNATTAHPHTSRAEALSRYEEHGHTDREPKLSVGKEGPSSSCSQDANRQRKSQSSSWWGIRARDQRPAGDRAKARPAKP